LGVATRLAILLGGLAALSTGLALVLQDQALDRDLRRAAGLRLERSAEAADRLIGDHLRSVARRYSAISLTPEFRANIGADHGPTLRYYASRLLDGQSATLIAFLGPGGEVLAPAGDPRLVVALRERLLGRSSHPAASCVGASEPGSSDGEDSPAPGGTFNTCTYSEGVAEATLLGSQADLYTLAAVPLRTGGTLVGGLVAIEPVSPRTLRVWSELSGGEIHPGEVPTGSDLETLVREFPGLEIRISTTYDAERGAIRSARRNLLVSGFVVLLLSLLASLFLARSFARPIVQMREATERLSQGRLDQQLELDREDEIGQLGRAFNHLVARLRESQERLRRAQRLARFGNWYLDFDTRMVNGTEEFHRLFGLADAESSVGWDEILMSVHPDDRERLERAVARSRQRNVPFRVDVRVQLRPGRDRILHLRGQPRAEARTLVEASAQDITERRSAEEQIRYLSLHDPLTGLGNWEYLQERLSLRLRDHRAGRPLALLVVGIDGFEAVNHTFGHRVGDVLLSEVAGRVIEVVSSLPHRARGDREPPDTVVSLGGARFGVILDGVGDEEGAGRAAQRLLTRIAAEYSIEGEKTALTASIGIAFWPEDAADADTLLRNCDAALHRSRAEGPGRYGFYHQSMHEDASRRLRVASLLRQAVNQRALELHYQPRVQIKTASVVGFEALARWTDPELGSVSPGEFIPVAESTGLIGPLGEWCLETAARQLREWHEAGHPGVSLSVNLARHQLVPGLTERILDLTEGLDRSRFEFEVTESALIEEGDEGIRILSELRAEGFRIALDDFGTGYSSLSYLQGLPIDTVKVDRGFIRAIGEDDDAAALTGSVLTMCRALRLHTVVEGVETEAQREILMGLGCEEAQGFLFSKPLPASEASKQLGRARRKRSRTGRTKSASQTRKARKPQTPA
jgi:diguanylate cyclase (GGDEF)-like protein/PAS domain S-box-containing protein